MRTSFFFFLPAFDFKLLLLLYFPEAILAGSSGPDTNLIIYGAHSGFH